MTALVLAGCGDAQAAGASDAPERDGGDMLRPLPDMNIPPASDRQLDAWLAHAFYDAWTCESGAHDSQAAPHGRVRVCSNAEIVDGAASGDYHVGAASVKELLDADDDVIGHAVALRGRPDAGATGWYFYARLQAGAGSALGVAADAHGVVADGWGDGSGNAQQLCAQCHARAARDFVFTDLRDR